MRVKILRRPPATYDIHIDALRPGRFYDLEAGLASALIADGCAEFCDPAEPDQRDRSTPRDVWESHDASKPWSRVMPGDDDPEVS